MATFFFFLLTYPKTAFVAVTMVLGLLMQTRVGAVARSPRGCTVRWAQGALFFLTAPMNTNSF